MSFGIYRKCRKSQVGHTSSAPIQNDLSHLSRTESDVTSPTQEVDASVLHNLERATHTSCAPPVFVIHHYFLARWRLLHSSVAVAAFFLQQQPWLLKLKWFVLSALILPSVSQHMHQYKDHTLHLQYYSAAYPTDTTIFQHHQKRSQKNNAKKNVVKHGKRQALSAPSLK